MVCMKTILVAEDILPIATFKARASAVVRSLRTRGRPMVITQNGKPAAVLLSPEEFDRLQAGREFRAAVRGGLADEKAGRAVSDRELDRILDVTLGKTRR